MRRPVRLALGLALAVPLGLIGLFIYAALMLTAFDPGFYGRHEARLAAELAEATADVPHQWMGPAFVRRKLLVTAEAGVKRHFDERFLALSHELSMVGGMKQPVPSEAEQYAETPLPGMLLLLVVDSSTDPTAALEAIAGHHVDYGTPDCLIRLEYEPDMSRVTRGVIVSRVAANDASWPEKAIGCTSRQLLRSVGLVHDTCRARPSVLCPANFVRRPTYDDLLLVRAQTVGPGRIMPRQRSAETQSNDTFWFAVQLGRRESPEVRWRRLIWLQEGLGIWDAAEQSKRR